MQPKVFTVNATAGGNTLSPVFVVDTYNVPTNIALDVQVSGSVGYTVQHNFVAPRTTNLNTLSTGWGNHQYLLNMTTASAGNYAFPPAGIRLLVSAGTGQCVFTIIQAGAQG